MYKFLFFSLVFGFSLISFSFLHRLFLIFFVYTLPTPPLLPPPKSFMFTLYHSRTFSKVLVKKCHVPRMWLGFHPNRQIVFFAYVIYIVGSFTTFKLYIPKRKYIDTSRDKIYFSLDLNERKWGQILPTFPQRWWHVERNFIEDCLSERVHTLKGLNLRHIAHKNAIPLINYSRSDIINTSWAWGWK